MSSEQALRLELQKACRTQNPMHWVLVPCMLYPMLHGFGCISKVGQVNYSVIQIRMSAKNVMKFVAPKAWTRQIRLQDPISSISY